MALSNTSFTTFEERSARDNESFTAFSKTASFPNRARVF